MLNTSFMAIIFDLPQTSSMPSPLIINLMPCVFVFVWCFLHFGLIVSTDPDHLCSKLATGSLDRINLKSITHYTGDLLMVYESNRKYLINRSDLTSTDRLPIMTFARWNEHELEAVSREISGIDDDLVSVYTMSFGDPKSWNLLRRSYQVVASVVTTAREFIWYIEKPKEPKKLGQTNGRPHPNYAIVFEQTTQTPSGYIVHKDIIDQSASFIMYDLGFEKQTLAPQIYRKDVSVENKRDASFYHLERTHSPNKIALVHRSHYNNDSRKVRNSDRQLFSSLPVGFKLGPITYLLDRTLGCVYIIADLPESLRESAIGDNGNLVFQRRNIRFEDFFECDLGLFPLNGTTSVPSQTVNRCDTNYIGYETPKEPDPQWLNEYIIYGVLIFFAIILVALICYLASTLWCHRKRKKSYGKKEKKSIDRAWESSTQASAGGKWPNSIEPSFNNNSKTRNASSAEQDSYPLTTYKTPTIRSDMIQDPASSAKVGSSKVPSIRSKSLSRSIVGPPPHANRVQQKQVPDVCQNQNPTSRTEDVAQTNGQMEVDEVVPAKYSTKETSEAGKRVKPIVAPPSHSDQSGSLKGPKLEVQNQVLLDRIATPKTIVATPQTIVSTAIKISDLKPTSAAPPQLESRGRFYVSSNNNNLVHADQSLAATKPQSPGTTALTESNLPKKKIIHKSPRKTGPSDDSKPKVVNPLVVLQNDSSQGQGVKSPSQKSLRHVVAVHARLQSPPYKSPSGKTKDRRPSSPPGIVKPATSTGFQAEQTKPTAGKVTATNLVPQATDPKHKSPKAVVVPPQLLYAQPKLEAGKANVKGEQGKQTPQEPCTITIIDEVGSSRKTHSDNPKLGPVVIHEVTTTTTESDEERKKQEQDDRTNK